MNKVYAVVVAGGNGSRMQHATPKQFLPVYGKELFIYTLDAFLTAIPEIQIILVLPTAHIITAKAILEKHRLLDKVQLVEGGETRFHSVKNGLQKINEEGIVMVHDAVRCMVSKEFLKRCLHACKEHGSSVPVLMSTDSVRVKDGDKYQVVDRETIFSIQTPQSFLSDFILPSFEIDYETSFTDEATVVEKKGHPIHFMEGEDSNIKITRPTDLIFAEHYFSNK